MWTRYFTDVIFASYCHFSGSPLKNVFVLWLLYSLIYIKFSNHLTQPDVIADLQNKFQMLTLNFSFFFFYALCFSVAQLFKFGIMNQHDSLRNIVKNIPNNYTHQVFVKFWIILVRIRFNGLVVRVVLDYQFSGSRFETTS